MNTILLETNVENFNFKVSIIDSYIFTVRVYTAYTGVERAESVRFVWTVRDGERTGRDVENVCIGEVQLRGSRRRWALLSGPSTGSVTGIGRGEAVRRVRAVRSGERNGGDVEDVCDGDQRGVARTDVGGF
jgi:hypothetical protein